jgi:hypothetical protein
MSAAAGMLAAGSRAALPAAYAASMAACVSVRLRLHQSPVSNALCGSNDCATHPLAATLRFDCVLQFKASAHEPSEGPASTGRKPLRNGARRVLPLRLRVLPLTPRHQFLSVCWTPPHSRAPRPPRTGLPSRLHTRCGSDETLSRAQCAANLIASLFWWPSPAPQAATSCCLSLGHPSLLATGASPLPRMPFLQHLCHAPHSFTPPTFYILHHSCHLHTSVQCSTQYFSVAPLGVAYHSQNVAGLSCECCLGPAPARLRVKGVSVTPCMPPPAQRATAS